MRESQRAESACRRGLLATLSVASVATMGFAQTWQQRAPLTSPSPRIGSANWLAYDPARSVATLFGGYQGTSIALADTWEWDGTAWTQRTPATAPIGRWGHGMAQDTRRGRAVMFGGYVASAGQFTNETWEWDGSAWRLAAPVQSPSARGYVAMAYDAIRGRVVMHGGDSGAALRGDTWTFDGANWTQVASSNAPSARLGGAMAFDSTRGECVLFGGLVATTTLQDTWVFDGAAWHARTPASAPSPRHSASMSCDNLAGRVVLFGGDVAIGQQASDTWAWDGANWTQQAIAGPQARGAAAMAFDMQRARTVLFGSSASSDTWELPSNASRSMTTLLAPGIGQVASFQYAYPPSAGAGHFFWQLLTPHFAPAVAVQVPGFVIVGSLRVDPTNILQEFTGFTDASGFQTTSVAIPSSPVFVGYAFDVQALDVDLATNTAFLASNDAEVTIGSGAVGQGQNLVFIQPGTFFMGSNAGQPNEQAVHVVTLTRPFWMGKYEVTQAEFLARMGYNPSWAAGAFSSQRPVETLSWAEAMAYCASLTASEAAAGRVPAGYQYRLPTEAEWEYCCRAGTTTEWNIGTSISGADANITDYAFGSPRYVGTYPPNAWGLHEMHGNVSEWCLDAGDLTSGYAALAVSDPVNTVGAYRAVRGGFYASGPLWCRSALREFSSSLTPITTGFRVVLAPSLVP